ncbi:MAG: amidohydrolase family protein [Deltaproteobacteria bacterium]|jgi:predicted amidohydrolase YtcJ|nr:amidohydrolase family protein [Deltaproteobacteria bacterium]
MKADVIFYNGEVLAMDGEGPGADVVPRTSVAVKDGTVVFPEDGGWKDLLGPSTEAVDLKGSAVIPGLVDAHLHPLWGGMTLSGFSLDYEPSDVEGTLERVRGFLADDTKASPDDMMTVLCWERHGGADVTAADLDGLGTQRPVLLLSGDCHTAVLNRRAMFIYRDFFDGPDPPDGRILRGPSGPNGILEDGQAFRLYDAVSRLELRRSAETLRRGLRALNRQGVTSVLDARANRDSMEAAVLLWENDDLTVRYSGAWEIPPKGRLSSAAAAAEVQDAFQKLRRYRRGQAVHRAEAAAAGKDGGPAAAVQALADEGHGPPRPGISMRHIKMFVDGMPGQGTAKLRTPYLAARDPGGGTSGVPSGDGTGSAYFDSQTLTGIFKAALELGLHPHCHVIADGALDIVLKSVSDIRARFPDRDFRPAAAHLDLAAYDQYARMRELGVAAVLSFQWAGYEERDLSEALAMFGPERCEGLETHGKFLDAGVTCAYGSDWPVESLDEWRNFQVGATRRMAGRSGPGFPRLDNDRDLTIREILFAATRASAWVLGQEGTAGRLAPGWPADLAVVEGPLLSRDPAALKDTRVTRTIVGGRTVWRAD